MVGYADHAGCWLQWYATPQPQYQTFAASFLGFIRHQGDSYLPLLAILTRAVGSSPASTASAASFDNQNSKDYQPSTKVRMTLVDNVRDPCTVKLAGLCIAVAESRRSSTLGDTKTNRRSTNGRASSRHMLEFKKKGLVAPMLLTDTMHSGLQADMQVNNIWSMAGTIADGRQPRVESHQ